MFEYSFFTFFYLYKEKVLFNSSKIFDFWFSMDFCILESREHYLIVFRKYLSVSLYMSLSVTLWVCLHVTKFL